MKVEITMEKTIRVAKVFDFTEEQLDKIKRGDGQELFFPDMQKELEYGLIDYDYAIDDMNGNEIIPWY